MKTENTVKVWETTRLQNLVRHKNGRYYSRLFLNGKEIWKSLKTSHFSVAEARLATLQKEHRERKSQQFDPANAKMNFEQAATLHMKRVNENVSIKRRTRRYWQEILNALNKSWPELAKTEIKRLTPAACRDWAARYSQTASPCRRRKRGGTERERARNFFRIDAEELFREVGYAAGELVLQKHLGQVD
jgi:hypothetical protein